jgi:hypothetical protein
MEYKYGSDAEGSRVLMRYQIGDGAAVGNLPPPTAAAPDAIKIDTVTISPPVALPPVSTVAEAPALLPADPVPTPVADAIPDPAPEPQPKPDAAPVAAEPVRPVAVPASAKTKSADAPGGTWHAQIMASQVEAAARKGLEKVLHSHAEILKDVPSGVAAARIGNQGMFYRAWLGQFASAAEAKTFCNTLKAGGVACTISQAAHGDDARISLSKL